MSKSSQLSDNNAWQEKEGLPIYAKQDIENNVNYFM